ncbi:PBN1 [[Candida] subhashii]|uniref:Protein PBN1 n=1 Tax=[Candida] subhashii TaxID=561895 RepID=A0A8J5UTA5_9ASCO|nr:PBN1 [[Candida] subhashii]KAG7665597.1 PBN1 [[Candida] subhashii]
MTRTRTIRQRTTIFNPQSSHEGIIKHLNQTNLQLQSIDNINNNNNQFIIENRYTIKLDTNQQYNHIGQFRLQTKFNRTKDLGDKIFPTEFNHGINLYINPHSRVQTEEDVVVFHKQVKKLLYELIGIEVDNSMLINNHNSLYYHNVNPINLNTTHELFKGMKLLEEDDDYEVILNDDKLVIRQVVRDVSSVQFNTEEGIYKEIGLFLIDNSISNTNDDIVLAGLRVILDNNNESESKNVHQTMFHIKPRHRYLNTSIHSEIIPKTGLHPILKTTFPNNANTTTTINITDDDVEECRLYYYINLESSFIFDQFQSIPENFNLIINNGIKNLELPNYKIQNWGNEILFESNQPFSNVPNPIEFTLHSRYQLPNQSRAYTKISNSLPMIFVGCNVNEANLLDKSPFDTHSSIGGNYEVYFTPDTVFYHFDHDLESNVVVEIPNGMSRFEDVNYVTTLAVVVGMGMVLVAVLMKVLKRGGTGEVVSKQKKNE